MRAAPISPPLVYVQKSSVYAIDRDNGQLRWRYETAVKLVCVLFVGERVFASSSRRARTWTQGV
jgi:hypothetical protein